MIASTENNCRCVEKKLKNICQDYLNKQIDQGIFRKRIADLEETYRVYSGSDFSFAYLLLCGYSSMFSEYEPDDNRFQLNVKEVLLKIENKCYISQSWFVAMEKTENSNIELLWKYWNESVNNMDEANEYMIRETENILENPIVYPDGVRDVIYNNILALLSMWEPSSGRIWVNHTVGNDDIDSEKVRDKLNQLFRIWFGEEKLLFQFNFADGNVHLWIM